MCVRLSACLSIYVSVSKMRAIFMLPMCMCASFCGTQSTAYITTNINSGD